jgi:saccharopine dehydrogenase-like NADP-dependent oxidoreductase
MRILLIGAGAQGGPCASILSRDPDISEIIIGDIDIELIEKVKDKIASPKITAQKLDAGDIKEVEKAAQGVDVIITLALTAFNDNIMKAALKVGAHYIDTSFGEGSLMDICERDNILSQIIENRPISLDHEFKEAGLTAIAGCGASPGVVNVLARYLADKLDVVDAIRIRIGRKNTTPPSDVIAAWQPSWSPFRALWGYAVEPTIFEDGNYKKYPIYSGYEEYHFSESTDMIPLVYHQHQEPITLPHFIGKGIQYCDFKYTIDKNAGTLIKSGFASADPVEVRGVKVAPIDLLMKITPKPVDSFFSETSETAGQPIPIAVHTAVEVSGKHIGQIVDYKITFPITMYSTPQEKLALFNKFGATNIYVSLPAVIGAKMCMNENTPRGVIAAECLEPKVFLKMLCDTVGHMVFKESCVKNMVFC